MLYEISDLQGLVCKLGEKINAPKTLLVLLSKPADDGRPYIVIHEDGFAYISSERGCEIFNRFTRSLDELLYWFMSGVAKQLALQYELENRVGGVDFRRVYFKRFVELVELMREEWGGIARAEIEETLRSSPFNDRLGV